MSSDRFVYWSERKPDQVQFNTFLEDFFGGAAQWVWTGPGRATIHLPGKSSHPFARLVDHSMPKPAHAERWIEVVLTDESVDILTRTQDEYTCVLADGMAVAVERFWRGEWRNH